MLVTRGSITATVANYRVTATSIAGTPADAVRATVTAK
jgi:hypothetical protein